MSWGGLGALHGGDSCHQCGAEGRTAILVSGAERRTGSWDTKASPNRDTKDSPNWNKTTPFECNPDSDSDEHFMLKPGILSQNTSLWDVRAVGKDLGLLNGEKAFYSQAVQKFTGQGDSCLILRTEFQCTSECNNMTLNITYQQKRIDREIE